MATHTIYFPDLRRGGEASPPGHVVTIEGEEAHHACRVKRLEAGDTVRLVDARGGWSDASLTRTFKRGREWAIELSLGHTHVAPMATPIVHACVAPPKGDRLAEMIDQLSQVGAASWTPLISERTVVEPREAKLDRLHRIAIEAMKQCGRAHALEIRPAVRLRDLVKDLAAGQGGEGSTRVIIADASGSDVLALPPVQAPMAAWLLVGPEGGFTPSEIESARAAGASVVSLGVHTMRIETAAVVGVGLLMARR